MPLTLRMQHYQNEGKFLQKGLKTGFVLELALETPPHVERKLKQILHGEYLEIDADKRLLIPCLAELMIGKNRKFLWSLNFREVENFLRDENHLPALQGPAFQEWEHYFFKLKAEFLGAWAFFLNQKMAQELSMPLADKAIWNSMGLVGHNRWGHSLAYFLELEFIYFRSEDSTLFLKVPRHLLDFHWNEYILSALGMNLALENEFAVKVVAVEA